MASSSYTLIKKNKTRPNAPWYIRARCDGKVTDTCLDTTDRATAEIELMKVKVAANESRDTDPLDALAVRQKEAGKALTGPGGTVEQWLDWLALQGMRAGTLRTYSRAVRLMFGNMPLAGLTPAAVVKIVRGTMDLKTSTRHTYVAALKSLFRHIKRQDLLEALPKVKVEISDRPTWTTEQMEDIISTVETADPAVTEEYRLWFSIMAAVGSRQGETALLRWCDLRYPGVLVFRAETCKNRREKVVPIPTHLFAEIDALRPRSDDLDDLYGEETNTGYIFPHIAGISQAARFSVLQKTLKKLGLRGGLHTFRHAAAEELYRRSNGKIKSISQILGHGPSTAMAYYLATREVEDLRELVEPEEEAGGGLMHKCIERK